jgi:hypothetical protein
MGTGLRSPPFASSPTHTTRPSSSTKPTPSACSAPEAAACAQTPACDPTCWWERSERPSVWPAPSSAASKPVIRLLENRARSYVFSTAPPPAQAATIVHALDMVTQADDRRAHVLSHARRLRRALTDQGWRVVEGDSPIVPVLIGPDDLTMRLSAELFERGIFVQGIRPPTVPAGTSRLRIVPMATHTPAHLDQLISAMHALRPLALPAP